MTGDNGVLTKSVTAKNKTEKAEILENMQLAVIASQINGEGTGVNLEELEKELGKIGITSIEKQGEDGKLPWKITHKGYIFQITENGEVQEIKGDAIEELVSGKVYYADLNGDNEPDGVIYADLTVGNKGSGKWSEDNEFYTIPNNLTNPKEYSVIVENYNGPLAKFGAGDIIAVSGNESGNDRFYIMDLSDFTTNGPIYDWYNAAYGKLDNYGDDQKVFGTGYDNTARMIANWNEKKYGEGDQCSSHKDMWGQIQGKFEEGWFVPSKAEWSAFAEELGITSSNYTSKGLSGWCWSSSQSNTYTAWRANFADGYMQDRNVNGSDCVRLSATF